MLLFIHSWDLMLILGTLHMWYGEEVIMLLETLLETYKHKDLLNLLPFAVKELFSVAFKGICRHKSRFIYLYYCVLT